MARGVVRFWKAEQGWGVISSDELPPGRDAWAHFSSIMDMPGYRVLEPGQAVDFSYEAVQQDGFDFRALRSAWPVTQRGRETMRGMSDDLELAMTEFQRCIAERDVEGASRVLDADYALVLVQPIAAAIPKERWLATLPDYVVHSYDVQEQILTSMAM